MSIPDLADRTAFPPFLELPEDHGDAPDDSRSSGPILLAQVKNDMTITKPTLVLSDRDGQPFALIFDGLDRDGLDLAGLGFKPGATVVVPGARRTVPVAEPSEDGKPARRPFIRIAPGQAHTVRAVPAALDRVLAAAERLRQHPQQDPSARQCAICGTASSGKKLLRCTGCGEVWYCSKACQTTGWTSGHKGECRAMRAVAGLWRNGWQITPSAGANANVPGQ